MRSLYTNGVYNTDWVTMENIYRWDQYNVVFIGIWSLSADGLYAHVWKVLYLLQHSGSWREIYQKIQSTIYTSNVTFYI